MKPKRITYVAQVARVRIETAIVEVAVADDADALAKAVTAAKRLPEAAWAMQPFDRNEYRPHMHRRGADCLVVAMKAL